MGDPVSPVRLQGILEKRGKFIGAFNARKCHCTIQDGQFSYRKEGVKVSSVRTIDICQVQAVRYGKENSFEIITRFTSHTFVAPTVTDRDNWVTALQETMRTLASKSPTADKVPFSNSENTVLYETMPDFHTQTSGSGSISERTQTKKNLPFRPEVATYEEITFDHDSRMTFNSQRSFEAAGSKNDLSPKEGCVQYELIREGEDAGLSTENLGKLREKSSTPESPADGELYAYASVHEIQMALAKDKPKLCFDYSSAHDTRRSDCLYSEVTEWARPEEEPAEMAEEIKHPVKSSELESPPVALYALAKDPDASSASQFGNQCEQSCAENQSSPNENHCDDKKSILRRHLKSGDTVNAENYFLKSGDQVAEGGSDVPTCSLANDGSSPPPSPVLYSMVSKTKSSNSSSVHDWTASTTSAEEENISKPEANDSDLFSPVVKSSVVELPAEDFGSHDESTQKGYNRSVAAKGQQVFSELRAFVNRSSEENQETVDHISETSSQTKTSAMGDLKNYLKSLG